MSRIVRATLLALTAVAALLALTASAWQWRRLTARRAANEAILEGRKLPPIDLAQAIASGGPLDGRSVTARGEFLTGGALLLRERVQYGNPGLQVVTPFRIDATDRIVWVLRGFVMSPDAFSLSDTIVSPAHGAVEITGLLLPIPETVDQGTPLVLNGDTTWHRLDRGLLQSRVPGSLPFYLHLAGDRDGPGHLTTVPYPTLDNGPHLSYAIQWLGIAAAILTFGYLMVWRRRADQNETIVPL